MKNLLHTVEKMLGVYRWHPKIALRYLPIVEEIKKRRMVQPTILEIGSGSLGIAPYIKQEVTGLDIDFRGPAIADLKKKRGNALRVPFVARNFDFVIMMDVLEHIAPSDRQRAVTEGLRVTKQELIIGVPCGQKAQLQDIELAKRYEKIHREPFHFCIEHVTFGLPEEDQVKNWIELAAKKLGRRYVLRVEGNINLTIRKFLMYGWMTTNPIIDVIFRKVFLLFVPVLRFLNHEPVYRKLFYISIGDYGKTRQKNS